MPARHLLALRLVALSEKERELFALGRKRMSRQLRNLTITPATRS